jgi:hypothetical protein
MIDMNDPEGLAGQLGKLDPVDVLDPVRWRRSWSRLEPWGMYFAGHQEKTSTRILTELRAVACETRKRIVNGLDVEDQYCRTRGLHEAHGELN